MAEVEQPIRRRRREDSTFFFSFNSSSDASLPIGVGGNGSDTTTQDSSGSGPDHRRPSDIIPPKGQKEDKAKLDLRRPASLDLMTKGWSSERVPPPSSSRSGGAQPYKAAAGRALPSKWEDAERWICSPVAAAQPRKPKAKSGPLGPPGFAGVPSPFSDGVSTGTTTRTEPCIARSVSVHGCSEKELKDAVSRRDMATQMSPEGSGHSSPDGRLSFSALASSALPIVELELQNIASSSYCDVRDVQVDERVTTVTRWSRSRRNRKKSSDIAHAPSSGWDMSDAATSISKSNREEAKINAWENLQKAKAETAIRKLEMKLETKRSSSMDKIMNKLRSAQKRAQEMRCAVLANQAHQVSKTSRKAVAFRRMRQMGSLSGCITCHAF